MLVERSRCQPLLGCYVSISLSIQAKDMPVPQAHARLASGFARAFEAIRQVDALMSLHRPDSELSRLRWAQPQEVIQVHPWTHEVLAFSQALYRASGARFDPGVARRLRAWGLLPGQAHPECLGMDALTILPGHRLLMLGPVDLDLGGVAKGFAVDQAVAALMPMQAQGLVSIQVNAGGDLRVWGPAQPIWLRDPLSPEQVRAAGLLENAALASSSPCFSRQQGPGGDWVSALVKPQVGQPILDSASWSVVAPTAMVADALTKLLACGADQHDPIFAQFDAMPIGSQALEVAA